ncbi:MAG: (2Fe-2S) ferredoxin domain-containing protein [Bacteroidales bacterium]|nr:(2Fe-2S) ferredoxin domain-containing protein [Bacteroidales bacterium]
MTITVCVGSSCHLKGSYDVIEKMREIISKYNLQDKVTLKAGFCLGHCAEGINIKCDEIFLHNVTSENAEEIFLKEVYERLS